METILLIAFASLLCLGLTVSYGVSVSGGGATINKSINRSGDHTPPWEVALPAGTAGELTTRSTDSNGVATLDAGHGLVTNDVVDVYWDGGVRYGMDATVSGNDVTVDGGAGDVLPAQSTDLVVTKQVEITMAIDGDNVNLIAFSLEFSQQGETSKGHLDLQDSGDATIEEIDLTANLPLVYDIEGGASNVFTGNPITHCHASNGSSENAATLKVIAAIDSTP